MALPGFQGLSWETALELRVHIADRVRLERRRLKMSQRGFAERCGIPLRTFKRFELGECDSLETFLRIVVFFERTVALELLFPPKQTPIADPRSPVAVLERVRARIQGEKS